MGRGALVVLLALGCSADPGSAGDSREDNVLPTAGTDSGGSSPTEGGAALREFPVAVAVDLLGRRQIELQLAVTLVKNPDLNDAGIGLSSTDRKLSREEQVAKFEKERAQIWTRIEAIEMAVVWLKDKVKPTKGMNPRRSSYGTKHIAEPDIAYISNGGWIAALLIAGFGIKCNPGSLNTDVALSERSLRAITDERLRNQKPYGWMRAELRERLGLPSLPAAAQPANRSPEKGTTVAHHSASDGRLNTAHAGSPRRCSVRG